MRRYLLNRGLLFIASVVLIVTISFFAVYMLPGDPARMILGPHADSKSVELFRATAGLDRPAWVQFGRFIARAARLDFGSSLTARRPVIDLIRERAPYTSDLILFAVASVAIFGVVLPIGLLALDMKRVDDSVLGMWTILAAAPPYVLAVSALIFFSSVLGWIPVIFDPQRGICWIAPAVTLAVYPTALVSNLLRHAMARGMESDYSFRARAQGYSERRILLREVLINSLSAPISAFANGLAYFATGTFFVEVAFGIGGLGSLTYVAIRDKDVAVLACVCTLFAVVIAGISTLLDLSQHCLDPVLRRSRE